MIWQDHESQHDHHHEVENDRADGDCTYASFGAERGSNRCHQSHQNDVGRDHEQQERGQRPALTIETRRDDRDDCWRKKNDEQGDDAADTEHHQQDAPGEAVGVGRPAVAAAQLEPDRHKGGIERAFRQQTAKEVDHLHHSEEGF